MVVALHDDLVHELAEQLPIKGVQEVWPSLQGFDQLLGLLDRLILLGLQEPFLLQLCSAELFRQLVPAGDKNVRVDKALLLELGQQSILTDNVCNFLVECHDVQAPE